MSAMATAVVLSTVAIHSAVALDKSNYVRKSDGTYAAITPWVWEMGWNHLVPSKSTLTDAEKVLGPGKLVSEVDSKQTYEFTSGVEVEVLKGVQTIQEILVSSESASKLAWPKFPSNKKEFAKQYGIAPGVTPTYTDDTPPRISRLKFSYLKTVNEDPLAGECKTRFGRPAD
jgi:hypothetical protein